mmetsp:Transcript_4467/g.11560  ORF Transcript_4467/g.11560 Transcript_4467/m.11560 type:complete len:217 (+) Transcript_4467:656-1306(+)
MLVMISEKKESRVVGSSGSSNSFAQPSQRAETRRSTSLTTPFEEECIRRLQWEGWNSAAVMTSESSSMFPGLMSMMLKPTPPWLRCQRLTRRSSAEMNVSWSELIETELMWYACALVKMRRGCAMTRGPAFSMSGRRISTEILPRACAWAAEAPAPESRCGRKASDENSATARVSVSWTRHSLTVLSFVAMMRCAELTWRTQRIWLIFSSISMDLR